MWIAEFGGIASDLMPAWIEAIATALGVLVAIAAIVLTFQQIRLTAEQLRATALRESQDSEDRTRPYISVDIVPGIAGLSTFDVVIANHGKTTAHGVRLALAGEEFTPQSESDEIGPALGRIFATGFDLAPGARRRFFWRLFGKPESVPPGDMGAPIASDLAVSYEWLPGEGRETRKYQESLRYDLAEYQKLAPVPNEGATVRSSSNDVNINLRNGVHALRAVAAHIAEIRR